MSDNYKNKYFDFINDYNIQNKENKRYLIVGKSGTMKTSLGISLILAGDFGFFKKITFIVGSNNIILNTLKKDFEKSDIEVIIHCPETKKELIDIVSKIKMSPGSLIFIDDISHFIKESSNFLIKLFTVSRQMKTDIILILHKYKYMNPTLRNNANKIFVTKIEKDVIADYPLLEKYIGQEPIVIENNELFKVNISDIGFHNINLDKKNLPIINKKETSDGIGKIFKIGSDEKSEMLIKKDDVDLKKKRPIDLKNEVRKGIHKALRR